VCLSSEGDLLIHPPSWTNWLDKEKGSLSFSPSPGNAESFVIAVQGGSLAFPGTNLRGLAMVIDLQKMKERFTKLDEYRCKNPLCQNVFKPRSDSNHPAFCSYGCGAAAQPEHCKLVLRHDRSGNNQKS